MKIFSRIFAFGVLTGLLQGMAIAVELICPPGIMVSQTVINAPPGWVASNSQREHKLSGVGFAFGPASEKAFLKPSYTKSIGKLRVVTHEFEGSLAHWVNCIYDDAAVAMGQPIPIGIKQCSVTYEVGRRGDWTLQSARCK